jgi:hypothetical protein
MRKRITKRVVDALEPSDRDLFVWDTGLTGFGCKVNRSGRKVYVLQYRTRRQGWKEAPKRLTLGKHGDITADDARELATKLLLEVKAGGDPAASWQGGESPTVDELAQRFLTEYLPTKKRPPRASTMAYYQDLFRCHIVPRLGRKRVADLSAEDVERLHLAMRDRPYAANRTVTVLRHALDQAERWGWRPQHTNPAAHIERYREERRGDLLHLADRQ